MKGAIMKPHKTVTGERVLDAAELILLLSFLASSSWAIDAPHQNDTHPIIGGTEVLEHEAPWLVSLGGCTGTLIDRGWVLTAAHCVSRDHGFRGKVCVGDDRKSRCREGVEIGRTLVHPKYNGEESLDYDVALIEILRPFHPMVPVTLVPMPEVGSNAAIMGFGYIDESETLLPRRARMAEIDLVPCRIAGRGFAVRSSQACVGRSGVSVMPGDSGGIVAVRLDNGEWGQIGVNSWRLTKEGSETGFAIGVFSKIESVQPWILEQLNHDILQVLPHVFAGPFGPNEAETEIVLTNLAPETDCPVVLLFSRGTTPGPFAVSFNGHHRLDNTLEATIEGGSTRRVVVTAPDAGALVTGAIYVTPKDSCELSIEARYLLHDQAGEVVEVFSVEPQRVTDWLRDGDCRTLSAVFDLTRNIGLAWVTAFPGDAAPEGTVLSVQSVDWNGRLAEDLPALPVTGEQTALNPWTLREPRRITLCLDSPGDNRFSLALITIGAKATGGRVQYFNQRAIRP